MAIERWMHEWKKAKPPRPVDPDWRDVHPIGSKVRLSVYKEGTGWHWKVFRVINYFPNVVHCQDKNGISRCFSNWEFVKRQSGRLENYKGGGSHEGIEEKIGEG